MTLRHEDLPLIGGAIVPAGGGRTIFALPWLGHTLVGTTDNDYEGPLEHIKPSGEDVDYLLDAVNAFFGTELGPAQLTGAYAGVRPLISTGDPKKSVDISRKAELYETSSGMITITGGKLTTWRRMAKMTVDRLVERDARDAPCRTHEIPLGQAVAVDELPRVEGVPEDSYLALASRYGHAAREVLALAGEGGPAHPSSRSRSSRAFPTCWPRSRSPRATSRPAASATCCCGAPASGCWRRASSRPPGAARRGRARRRGASDLREARRRGARRASCTGAASGSSWSSPASPRRPRPRGSPGAACAARTSPRPARRSRRRCRERARAASARLRADARAPAHGHGRQRPWLMGIVNASPDSFSDGGRYVGLDAQVRLARELLAAGADILDVGGESASTGRPPVQAREEIALVVPLIERLAGELGALVSVDTYKPEVARAAIAAGARIVNDVSGLRDPSSRTCARETGAALVLMHTRAAPRERLQDADLYDDVTGEVMDFLRERIALAVSRGVAREQLIARPGPGLRQDARADDPAARRGRAPARARAAAADGDLAQGLHRRADRARAARAPRRHARRARPRRRSTARTSSACTTWPPRRTSSRSARRSRARLEPGRDLALAEEIRYERAQRELTPPPRSPVAARGRASRASR